MMVLMYAGNNLWKRKTKAICIMRLLTEMISINRIVLTCVAVSSIYTPVFASPVLHVSRTNVDLGEVYAHAKQRVKFEFKNSGDKLLTLEEATSGCVECVTVDFPKQGIAPGKSAVITVGVEPTGNFRNTISLRTNDPKYTMVDLTVSGKAKDAVKLQPSFLYFGLIPTSGEWHGTAYVVPQGKNKFTVRAKGGSNTVSAKVGKPNAEGGFPILVTVKPNGYEGRISQHIELTLSLPGRPVIDLLVLGESHNSTNRPK